MGNASTTWDDLTNPTSSDSPPSSITLHTSVTKFDNLHPKYVEKLWRHFTSVKDNFAVDLPELQSIFALLKNNFVNTDPELSMCECSEGKCNSALTHLTKTLYEHWIGLQNKEATAANVETTHLDFMEVMMALVFCSNTSLQDKAEVKRKMAAGTHTPTHPQPLLALTLFHSICNAPRFVRSH